MFGVIFSEPAIHASLIRPGLMYRSRRQMPTAAKLLTTGMLPKLVTLILQCTDSFHSN